MSSEPRGPRVVIYPEAGNAAGPFRWHLVAGNGEVVLPQEGHRDPTDARRAMERAAELLTAALAAGHVVVEGPAYSTPAPAQLTDEAREREEWHAVADADAAVLKALPIEAHIASAQHLARRLLELTEPTP